MLIKLSHSAGGLAGLIPQASELQRQLQASRAKLAAGWSLQSTVQPGPKARWVAEAELPLWLVRGQEERARREAALAAAEAERIAARVSDFHATHSRLLIADTSVSPFLSANVIQEQYVEGMCGSGLRYYTSERAGGTCRKCVRLPGQAQLQSRLQTCVRSVEGAKQKV